MRIFKWLMIAYLASNITIVVLDGIIAQSLSALQSQSTSNQWSGHSSDSYFGSNLDSISLKVQEGSSNVHQLRASPQKIMAVIHVNWDFQFMIGTFKISIEFLP